jgi:hypothetical protein
MSPAYTSTSTVEDTGMKNDLGLFRQYAYGLSSQTDLQELKNKFGIFVSILTRLLDQTNYSLETLRIAENTTTVFISVIPNIVAQLSKVANSRERQIYLGNQLRIITNKHDDIVKKITTQETIDSDLQKAHTIPNQNTQEKAVQYTNILNRIDKNTLNTIKQAFITYLEELSTYAKTKGKAEIDIVTNLLKQAQRCSFFDDQQQQQLATMMREMTEPAPTETPAPTAMPPTPAVPQPVQSPTPQVVLKPGNIQTKIAEIKALPTLLKKIQAAETLLPLLTTETTQDELNAVLTLCNEFATQFLSMNKGDFVALLNFFENVQKNQFISPEQRQKIASLHQDLVQAALLSSDKEPLLGTLKNKINSFDANNSDTLNAALYVFQLLEKNKLPQEEINATQPTSMVSLLNKHLQLFFNKRITKITQMAQNTKLRTTSFVKNIQNDFETMLKLFEKAKVIPAFANIFKTPNTKRTSFGDKAIATLKLDIDIFKAKTATSPDIQITELTTISRKFLDFVTQQKTNVDAAEIALFMNILTDFVSRAADKNLTTLQNFLKFLQDIQQTEFIEKRIKNDWQGTFDEDERARFAKWSTKIADIIKNKTGKQQPPVITPKPTVTSTPKPVA